MERVTRFELATHGLGSHCSTTELYPHIAILFFHYTPAAAQMQLLELQAAVVRIYYSYQTNTNTLLRFLIKICLKAIILLIYYLQRVIIPLKAKIRSVLIYKFPSGGFYMLTGIVKWFNPEKGYGFITLTETLDAFVHFTAINMKGFRTLNEGDIVQYEIAKGKKGYMALNVRRL